VLGLAIDAGVLVQRVEAADDVGHARGIECLERVAVDLALLLRYPELPVREGLPLLTREIRVFRRDRMSSGTVHPPPPAPAGCRRPPREVARFGPLSPAAARD